MIRDKVVNVDPGFLVETITNIVTNGDVHAI